jgi:hypothetical protein
MEVPSSGSHVRIPLSMAAYFNQINIRLLYVIMDLQSNKPFPNFANASTSHPSIPLFNEKGETKSTSLRHGRTLGTVVYYPAPVTPILRSVTRCHMSLHLTMKPR